MDPTLAIGFTRGQQLALVVVWVGLFLLPAFWIRARAKKDGEAWGKWFALTLVASVLGVVEYFEHRSVVKRRARRGLR